MTAPVSLGELIGANIGVSDGLVPKFALGTTCRVTNGGTAIYVKANTAVTGEGYVVLFDTAYGVDMLTTTNGASKLGRRGGVAQCALALNEYGWVIIAGQTQLRTSNSTAANSAISSTATAGQVSSATTTGLIAVLGIVALVANSSGSAANVLAEATGVSIGAALP